ncbi:MAG: aminotransferase class III-fold pyridoxal phosphate-dependent enzyme [Candidatus Omnitrophica bacterium]|nr:aminotransferase class III-fold pyridoxal phosphate-dependent enzyme [Candidatus Omnitrophota bacterium]
MRLKNTQTSFHQADKILGTLSQSIIPKYAQRTKLFDFDDNVFTDYYLAGGALFLGHANKNVVVAVKKAAQRGINFEMTTREEISLAQDIQRCVPWLERLCFFASESEAIQSAVELARSYTQKEVVLALGHFPELTGSAIVNIPFNDEKILEETVLQNQSRVACVVVQPVLTENGIVLVDKKFLETLDRVTKKQGIVVIFDERKTGFRFYKGVLQSQLGFIADITCLGGVLSAGFPLGICGGKKEILEHAHLRMSLKSPIILKASLATLRLLNGGFYKSLDEKCRHFCEKLELFIQTEKVEAEFSHYGSLMHISLLQNKENDYNQMFLYLLEKGIYFSKAGSEPFYITGVHSKRELEDLLNHLKQFFKRRDA